MKVEQRQRLPDSADERLARKNLKRSKVSRTSLGAVALTSTEPYQSYLKNQLREVAVDQCEDARGESNAAPSPLS